MKQYLLTIFLLSQFWLSGQIGPCTIDGGKTPKDVFFRVDNLPDNFSLGFAGDNNSWIFSSLQAPRSYTYKYTTSSEGRYSSYFSDANIVLREPKGKEIFFMDKGGRWYELGYVAIKPNSIEPEIVRYSVPINACTPFDYDQPSVYEANMTLNGQEVTRSFRDIKDATGILYLSDGTYDADRVKRVVKTTAGGITSTTSSYIFIDQLTGIFLMEVILDDFGRPSTVKYLSQEPSPARTETSVQSEFLLYPDVGYGDVRLEFNNFKPGSYSFIVFDIIGRKLLSKSYNVQSNMTIKEDLSFLPKGRYHYTIIDSEQNKIVTRRLAIIKS